MKRWLGGRLSALSSFAVAGLVAGIGSGPAMGGSAAFSGTNTAAPLLTVWSTPWSKNWPKNVNSELYGGERPTSVVTFGMKSVLWEGTQSAGTPTTGGSAVGSGSVVQGTTPPLP